MLVQLEPTTSGFLTIRQGSAATVHHNTPQKIFDLAVELEFVPMCACNYPTSDSCGHLDQVDKFEAASQHLLGLLDQWVEISDDKG